MSVTMQADLTKPLKEQKKPDFVCEPGDPRVKKFGWTKSKFRGYLSIIDHTIWISSVWSNRIGCGNYSRLVKNIHKAGYEIKVPSPFPRMEAICEHLGFKKTEELFEEIGETITVYVLPGVPA
jgi:hypothetical protein